MGRWGGGEMGGWGDGEVGRWGGGEMGGWGDGEMGRWGLKFEPETWISKVAPPAMSDRSFNLCLTAIAQTLSN